MCFFYIFAQIVPVVQWIELWFPVPSMGVRIPPGAHFLQKLSILTAFVDYTGIKLVSMAAQNKPFHIGAFLLNLALPIAIGALGGLLTATSVKTWYPTLNKPSFNPPNNIFPPVWTLLFILMGISAYLVWRKREQITHFPRTLALYFIQLILNLMWSFIFFYAREIGMALIEIFILLAVVITNARVFYKIDKLAGLLFIPYILWVSFATLLTYSIYSLN